MAPKHDKLGNTGNVAFRMAWTAVELDADPLSLLNAPIPITSSSADDEAEQLLAEAAEPIHLSAAPISTPAQEIIIAETTTEPNRSSTGSGITLPNQILLPNAWDTEVATSTATRFELIDDSGACSGCGEGHLVATGGESLSLMHVVRGAPIWRVRPGADCRIVWLHDSHAATSWAPANRTWIVHGEPTKWLLVFRSAYEAERVAERIDCVEPAWSTEATIALHHGALKAAAGLRGAAEALVHGVRTAKDTFVENVDGQQASASQPVDPNVRAAVEKAREVASTVKEVGDTVLYTVGGLAYTAGRGIVEASESAGINVDHIGPNGRAARQITNGAAKAALDVLTELGSSMSTVWDEGTKAVTEAVQHTQGDEAAEVTSHALESVGNVGGVVMSVAPTVLARKAVFAGVLGAADVPLPQTGRRLMVVVVAGS